MTHNYIDGIPVKISEQLRPPPKVVFPVNLQNTLNSDVLGLEYDFSIERRIIDEAKEREEAKALEEARIEAENAKRAEKTKTCQTNGEIVDETAKFNEETEIKPVPATIVPMGSTGILTPLPSTNIVQNSEVIKPQNFNPADFEGDTSSPFDNMELKTINELEELNNVFQKLNPCPNNNMESAPSNSSSHDNNAIVTSQSNNSYPSTQYYSNIGNNDYSSAFAGPIYPQQPTSTYNSSTMINCDNRTFEPIPVTKYSPVIVNYGTLTSSKSNLRSSKSASDLSSLDGSLTNSESNSEYCGRPKSVEPANPSVDAVRRDKLQSSESSEQLFANLDEAQMKVVNHFCDMGFPKVRAARAVLLHGTDQKQLLDWLCSVQTIADKGYHEIDVENALQIFNSNLEKTEEFLKLLLQLMDFGFEKPKVKQALIRSSNDRDKALDLLLS